ncbi:hypothetical protein G7Y89_g8032 [Cudoniella acicularis]|uniref:Uncharacterized protein n=1 Tax=Cudoniella acicularis TaxID=354080 RepID=A0A8H4RIW5_9HELO|nr:hypothetical protein G7Y89_g8032 [Cudoniella acicularis]
MPPKHAIIQASTAFEATKAPTRQVEDGPIQQIGRFATLDYARVFYESIKQKPEMAGVLYVDSEEKSPRLVYHGLATTA